MEKHKKFKPVIVLLSNIIEPEELARLLDELSFDYSRKSIRLIQLEEDIEHADTHNEAGDFLLYLKFLRDALRECEK